jgi:ABC-type nitrate/sulfonate/bicarbonate transport system ATPase subunit
VRRLLALVANLPRDAMTHGAWRVSDELQAQQVEVTHEVLRAVILSIRVQLSRQDQAKLQVPNALRIPRPGDVVAHAAEPPKLTREGIRRALMGR